MAGWFTHLLVAFNALQKLPKSKRSLLSEPAHFDDYLFGAVAPDVHYILSPNRPVTHELGGEKQSAFSFFKSSTPFVAGYESHLIADDNWEAVTDFFHIDLNKLEQKLALYFAVDRYFRAKSDWFLPVTFSGNVARADDIALLGSLGFNAGQISAYKALISGYLLVPDIGSFLSFLTRLPFPLNERQIISFLDAFIIPKGVLNSFFKDSVNNSKEEIASNL